MKPYKLDFLCFLVFMSVSASQNLSFENQDAQRQKNNNDRAERSGFAVVNGVWPISNSTFVPDELSSPFGPRYVSTTFPYDFHDGVDIRTLDVFGNPSTGIDVHAFYNGTVTEKGTFPTRANTQATVVRILHQDPDDGDHFWTEYVHIEKNNKWNAVFVGMPVTKGQYILDSGNEGTTTPHLHFNGLIYPTYPPPAGRPDQDIDAINPMRTDGLNYSFNSGPRLV